ncbi:MAG TPA: DUF2924 domain-containing protein [Allosphingosinicella sp.]|jgi:hypothetical protein
MARIEEELAALAAMSAMQLRAEYQRVMRKPASAIPITLIERSIAYELQVKRFGGLPAATRRQIEKMSRELERTGSIGRSAKPWLRAGTRLTRDWHGHTYHVLVVENGFEFEQRHYSSLSQVASAITGTGRSGPRFFGLTRRAQAGASRDG